jgi:hypothetical protein
MMADKDFAHSKETPTIRLFAEMIQGHLLGFSELTWIKGCKMIDAIHDSLW